MIHQVQSIKTKTEALPPVNKGLLQVRHIQARLNGQPDAKPLGRRAVWSPITAGPFMVPVTRWVE